MEDAIAEYKKAIKIKPEDVNLLRTLGYAYQQVGKFKDAIVLYKSYLAISPNNFESEEILELIDSLKSKIVIWFIGFNLLLLFIVPVKIKEG